MRKIFTLLILLLLLPVTALAADMNTVYVGGVALTGSSGSTVYATTNENGEVITKSATANNYNIMWDGSTLTLNGAKIKGAYSSGSLGATAGIYAFDDSDDDSENVSLNIALKGVNEIFESSNGIWVFTNAGNATLTIEGDGSLNASGSSSGILVQSNSGDATLTIRNADVTAENSSSSGDGVTVRAGSSSSASLSVDGGSLTATGKSEHGAGIQYTFGSRSSGSGEPSLTVSNSAIVRANGGISTNSSTTTTVTPTVGGENGGIVFNNDTGAVYGNVTLQENLEIGEDESLTIPQGASLTVPEGTTLTNNGTIVNAGGTLNGEPVGTGKIENKPTIDTQPTNATVTEGETASFTVAATGENLSYQWQQSTDSGQSWTDIEDATDATYTIGATTTSMSGNQYRCVVSNSAGSVTSAAATLTVTAKPTYTITAVVVPEGAGSVKVNDSGTSATVVESSEVTLTATANEGYRFTGWTSSNGGTFADASSVSTTFTMPANDVIVTAGFEQYYPVTSITLDKSELSLSIGDSETLTATIEPGDATNKTVTWSSDKPGVAAVDASGKVTAKAAGKATITAMADGGKTATCVVKVRKPATVEASGSTNLSFTTDQDEFTLTATVQVNGDFLNPTDGSWTWNVADADVVALSGSPTWRSQSYSISRQAFTVEGTGTTTITATYDDGTYRGSVDFTVRISKPTPPDPISYYNIYVEDVCDGVEVTLSNNVVREGNSISAYVKKDTANYTFDNFKVYYKRSYYGGWEELKEGTQPGEYPIKNIWTHIYIKAEGAEEKEDPTGIESIEGVKVYTKDGSLYVQTPQREQVIIVSMSGAVVKNEEQIGLKQYHGLQPGIYIVRVGDRAYKLRLN